MHSKLMRYLYSRCPVKTLALTTLGSDYVYYVVRLAQIAIVQPQAKRTIMQLEIAFVLECLLPELPMQA